MRSFFALVLVVTLGATTVVRADPAAPEPVPEPPKGASTAAKVGLGVSWAVSIGLVLGLGTRAWWDEGYVPFHFKDTGFYGGDTYSGGADKQGHMHSSFTAVHLFGPLYERMGFSRTDAAWLAAGFAFFVFNGFELVDGFTRYGFEYGDVIFNTLGVGSGLATRLSPRLDSMFGLRMGYFPSRDFTGQEQKSILKFINDYTGTLFFMDVKGKGVMEALGKDPGFLRYLLGGAVYATQGYSPIKQPVAQRRRLLGVHVGLSIPALLDETGIRNAGMDVLRGFFDLYGMPGVSLMLLRDFDGTGWYLSLGIGNRAQFPL